MSDEGEEKVLWFHALSIVYYTAPVVYSTPSDTLRPHVRERHRLLHLIMSELGTIKHAQAQRCGTAQTTT